MPASQREKIRQAHKARLASSAASETAASSAASETAEPLRESVGGIEVEVTGQPPAAPVSLLERIRSGIKQDTKQIKSTGKAPVEEESFLFVVLPVVSGFLTFYAGGLWPDKYKVCAPTKAEVSAILTPPTRMLARRLDIRLEETPDLRDMRLAATALLLYVVRAATTAIDIQERIETENAIAYAESLTSYGHAPGGSAARNGTRGTYQGAATGTVRPSGGAGQQYQFSSQQSTATQGSSETDAEYARRVISEAFATDKLYRSQHGLL